VHAEPDDVHLMLRMSKAGDYLQERRRMRKWSQSDLAEAAAVGRGTIQRLERGDERVGVGTVLRVLHALGVSPWHYYRLATSPAWTLPTARHHQAVLHGMIAYIQRLAECKHLPVDTLVDAPTAGDDLSSTDTGHPSSAFAVLLALIALDAPLADLAPLVRASSDHETVGRQMAEARDAFTAHMQQVPAPDHPDQHSIPILDASLYRLATILRYRHDLPVLLHHELARIEADLKRHRAFLVLAINYLKMES
jgi:transcriptional regulator with XRE-family HTH domain